jgi:hypothetical protein
MNVSQPPKPSAQAPPKMLTTRPQTRGQAIGTAHDFQLLMRPASKSTKELAGLKGGPNDRSALASGSHTIEDTTAQNALKQYEKAESESGRGLGEKQADTDAKADDERIGGAGTGVRIPQAVQFALSSEGDHAHARLVVPEGRLAGVEVFFRAQGKTLRIRSEDREGADYLKSICDRLRHRGYDAEVEDA